MSKTWRRHGGVKDNCNWAQRAAAAAVRRYPDKIPDGGAYRKIYNSWSISDYSFVTTVEQERHEFHHPYEEWNCPCAINPRGVRYARMRVPAPEPVCLDGVNWTLPQGFEFARRWMAPEQRVNPATGVYEHKVRWIRYEYCHERVSADYRFTYEPYPTKHSYCRYKDMEWRQVEYYDWAPNPHPDVYQIVPDFLYNALRWPAEREKQTRNYRKKQHWPRYWRRDRRRVRGMKMATSVDQLD